MTSARRLVAAANVWWERAEFYMRSKWKWLPEPKKLRQKKKRMTEPVKDALPYSAFNIDHYMEARQFDHIFQLLSQVSLYSQHSSYCKIW